MKNIIIKILPIILVVIFSGCYTVVWNPSTDLPSESDSYNNNYYYGPDFYGDYYYYYDTPWWWALNRPAAVKPNERSRDNNAIRNNDGGRNSTPDRGVIDTDRPTVDSNSGSNSGNDSPRKSNSSSGNNSNTQTRSSNNRSGDNNSIRNNDGSRNSGSRR